MNKTELVKAIADKSELTQTDVAKFLDATLETITESLTNNEDVTLIGFGTFSLKERAERQGKNPQTGEPMTIKAARVPHLKFGKKVKEAVNG